LILIVLSLTASVELIRNLVVNMQKTPIVFYIDDVPIPVTDVNFPAITLCPGLIIKNAAEILIDYNKMTKDLEDGRIDRTNFTQLE
jgi:hypothetical protein